MPEMDQSLKWLIEKRRDDLIALALPGAVVLGPLPSDVASGPQLLPDTLYKIQYHDLECAANIEIQAYPDETMPRRMYEYGTRIDVLYNLPVFSIVLWVHKSGSIPKSPYERRVGPHVLATWNFINIDVRKLSASAMMESGGLGIVPLIPLMQGANEQLMAEAMRRVKEEAPEEDIGSLALLLTHFIARKHKPELASLIYRRFFMSNIDLLKDSPLYPILTKEARVEGKRESIRDMLEGRFGPVGDDVIQALNKAGEETLKAIAVHAGTDTLEQIRSRLGLSETQG
jgi:hypothetical protein